MSGSLSPADVCDVCFKKHAGTFVSVYRSWDSSRLETLCVNCWTAIISAAAVSLADRFGGEVVRSLA